MLPPCTKFDSKRRHCHLALAYGTIEPKPLPVQILSFYLDGFEHSSSLEFVPAITILPQLRQVVFYAPRLPAVHINPADIAQLQLHTVRVQIVPYTSFKQRIAWF
ncbi:unnamed protein product, partial [Callosobruchus maculatus]